MTVTRERRRDRQLRTTTAVIATIAVVVVAFVVLVGVVTVQLTRRTVVATEAQQLEALADAKEGEITALLDAYRSASELVAGETEVRELLVAHRSDPRPEHEERLSRVLRDAVEASPQLFRSASLSDPEGTIIASNASSLVGRTTVTAPPSLGDRFAFELETSVEAFVEDGHLTILVQSPVREGGELVGFLEVQIIETDLQLAIQAAGFEGSGEIVVGTLDTSADVARFVAPVRRVADATSQEIAAMSATEVPMVQALLGVEDGFPDGMVDYDGVPVMASTRYLPEMGWGLVVKIDRAEVVAPSNRVRTYLLLLAGAALVLSTVGGLLARSRIAAALHSQRTAESRFAMLFQSSPVPLLAVDGEGVIRLANAQAAELLTDGAELTGRSVDDFVPTRFRRSHEALRHSFAANPVPRGMGRSSYVTALTDGGDEVPVAVSLTPLESGGSWSVVVALIDLSDQVADRERLEAWGAKLAQANEELDSFASAAAHDLKAPVRAMSALANMILTDHEDDLPDDVVEDVQLIEGRSLRLTAMVEGLLDYARIGHDEAASEQIDMNQLVSGLVDLYVPADRFVVERETLHDVHGPRPAIELVVRNLLGNAVKHHDRGEGVIEIRSGIEGDRVWTTVYDDGPGIPAKHHDRIFGLFKTLQPRDRVESSGLGLSLVKKTLDTTDGTIEVVPTDAERGTTFRVTWPAADPQPVDRPLGEYADA